MSCNSPHNHANSLTERAKYSHMLYAWRMNNLAQLKPHDPDSARSTVAAEVRGHLAKKRIPAYKLSEVLGGPESRGYWQRRVTGELPFDIDDLERLAALFGIRITDFFGDNDQPRPLGTQAQSSGDTVP